MRKEDLDSISVEVEPLDPARLDERLLRDAAPFAMVSALSGAGTPYRGGLTAPSSSSTRDAGAT